MDAGSYTARVIDSMESVHKFNRNRHHYATSLSNKAPKPNYGSRSARSAADRAEAERGTNQVAVIARQTLKSIRRETFSGQDLGRKVPADGPDAFNLFQGDDGALFQKKPGGIRFSSDEQ